MIVRSKEEYRLLVLTIIGIIDYDIWRDYSSDCEDDLGNQVMQEEMNTIIDIIKRFHGVSV